MCIRDSYQRDEVQEIADITGDSLGLSQEAAKTTVDVIVFCGVHFMAESAAILSPGKTVLLPREAAAGKEIFRVAERSGAERGARVWGPVIISAIGRPASSRGSSTVFPGDRIA